MSTAVEIEAAIRTLSPTERKKLVRDLPALLPELDGDEAWKRIMDDPTPNPALSAYVDAIDAEQLISDQRPVAPTASGIGSKFPLEHPHRLA